MRSGLPDGWIRQVPQTRLQQSGAPVVACATCERVQRVFVRGGQAAACMGVVGVNRQGGMRLLWRSVAFVRRSCVGAGKLPRLQASAGVAVDGSFRARHQNLRLSPHAKSP